MIKLLIASLFTLSVFPVEPGNTESLGYEMVGSRSFNLDDQTINLIDYLQYYQNGQTNVLSFLNERSNAIYLYDYDTQKFLRKYVLAEFGIKDRIQGYCIDGDNIWTYTYYQHDIYKIDLKNSTVTDHYLFKRPDTMLHPLYPTPYLTTGSPMTVKDGKIYFTGLLAAETKVETANNRPTLIIFDTRNKKSQFKVNYTSQYVKYNWGGSLYYRLPYYTFAPNGDIVISLPAEHSILCYSENKDLITLYNAKSANVTSIKPFKKNKKDDATNAELLEWYLNTPSYGSILYDKYRHLFYRVLRLPQTVEYNSKKGVQKPIVIIVLDEQYNILGECHLPEEWQILASNMFVSENGLSFPIRTENEDELLIYDIIIKIPGRK